MKNYDSHFWLYAKHFYHRGDVIEDLKKILSNYSGVDVKYISFNDVLSKLISLSFQFMKEHDFSQFISNLYRFSTDGIFYNVEDVKIDYKAIVKSLLSFMSTCKVIDDNGNRIIELDEPDYSILPKR